MQKKTAIDRSNFQFCLSALYSCIVVFVFLVLPFCYFFYEEGGDDDDDVSTRSVSKNSFSIPFTFIEKY